MIVRRRLRTFLALCCVPILSCPHLIAQQASQPQDSPLKLEVNVNIVLVPVVVRDKQGHVVADLKREDFQVFDNDKPHSIFAFTVENRGAQGTSPESASPSSEQSPAPGQIAPQAPEIPERIAVFLFDDMHLSFEDLAYARKAGAKALTELLSGTTMAAMVSTSGKVNSGFAPRRLPSYRA